MSLLDALLLHRDGVTWALDRSAVAYITRREGGVVVGVDGGELPVDEVTAVAGELAVRGVGPVLRQWLPAACCGLTVRDGQPVVVLHPAVALREWGIVPPEGSTAP